MYQTLLLQVYLTTTSTHIHILGIEYDIIMHLQSKLWKLNQVHTYVHAQYNTCKVHAHISKYYIHLWKRPICTTQRMFRCSNHTASVGRQRTLLRGAPYNQHPVLGMVEHGGHSTRKVISKRERVKKLRLPGLSARRNKTMIRYYIHTQYNYEGRKDNNTLACLMEPIS